MTFEEARDRLTLLFPGYRSVRYGLTEHDDGEVETKCSLYTNDHGSAEGSTWEEAFDIMLQKMGKSIDAVDMPGAPVHGCGGMKGRKP